MSNTNRLKVATSADAASAATVVLTGLSPEGYIEFTANGVDGSGDFAAATAGTAAIEVITATGQTWEPLKEADGTTDVSIDLTSATPITRIVESAPLLQIRAVPAGVTGTPTAIRLAVLEAR